MPTPLDAHAVATALATMPAWVLDDGTLRRDLRFADFSEAFAFVTRVALLAERMNHHPDLSISWSRVTLELTSHDAGGVTERDIALAHAVDKLVPG